MIAENRKLFANALREARTAAGLTLRELADRSDILFSNIGSIEAGRVIAGMKQATKLVEGLGLKGQEKENLLLVASLSSRRSNPNLQGASPQAAFLRSLPWMLQRLGLKALSEFPEISLLKFSELPPEHPPVAVVFENRRLNVEIKSPVLRPDLKQYLRRNSSKHFFALIIRADKSQTLIECGSRVFD